MLAGLLVISVVSAAIGYVIATLFWDNWIRLRWRRKLARARDQRHEASTSDTAAGCTPPKTGRIAVASLIRGVFPRRGFSLQRSEESRVGKTWCSKCNTRWV